MCEGRQAAAEMHTCTFLLAASFLAVSVFSTCFDIICAATPAIDAKPAAAVLVALTAAPEADAALANLEEANKQLLVRGSMKHTLCSWSVVEKRKHIKDAMLIRSRAGAGSDARACTRGSRGCASTAAQLALAFLL